MWFPIVYGRTYSVDFRFITIPNFFKPSQADWAIKYIVETAKRSEKLRDGTMRWSIFRDETTCIFGLTCMARDLTALLDLEDSSTYTKDMSGVPVYVFVGLAAEEDKGNTITIPSYNDELKSIFAQIYYDSISSVWNVKNFETSKKEPSPSNKREFKNFHYYSDRITSNAKNEFNLSKKKILFAPYSENEKIWQWASGQKNISLCLNLYIHRELTNSLFMNATVSDVDKYVPLKKQQIENTSKALTLNVTEEQQNNLNNQGGWNLITWLKKIWPNKPV